MLPSCPLSLPTLRRTAARLTAMLVLATSIGAALVTVDSSAAFAESTYTMESEFVAKMNAARESAGLRPYSVAGDLTYVARSHSAQMAARQSLYHNPNLTTDVQNWQAVGENVGEGPTVSDIHTAFMNSAPHRANILDHDFTQVGVGVSVDKNGIIWVTEDFREPQHTSAPAPTHTTAPAPTHTTAPARARTTAPVTHSTQSSSSSSSAAETTSPATRPAAPTHPAAHPSPAATRAALLQRLHAARAHQAAAAGSDPVAQAFDYVATLTTLAG